MRLKFKRGKVVIEKKGISKLRLNSETPRMEVPAGRPYNERQELLTLTKNANVELNHSICDVKGKMPIFGYPPLQFSPKNELFELTDRKVWNHHILSNGKSIKHPEEDEFKMIPTDLLKLELS